MIAYVFTHWKQPGIDATDYEARQRAFHAALNASPPAGYRGSCCSSISGAPWAAAGGAAYEDWYRVDDFTALGALNEAAITASRSAPHDAAAQFAAGGTAGVYGLRIGASLASPRHAYWFGKPDGARYPQLFARLTPYLDRSRGALWMRQMVLGASPEFCVHTVAPVTMPSDLDVLAIELRPVWPG